jgi:hypothetical protein
LDATEQLLQLRKDAGWRSLLALQTWRTYKDVRRAKAEHAREMEKFESPEERAKRTSRIDDHNDYVDGQCKRLPKLKQDLGESERESTALTNLRLRVPDAIAAARADGWIAPNFPEKFQAMAQHLEAGKLAEATGCLSELEFQCTPSTQTYESWCQEATQILEKAYADYSGFAAAGAYTEIARRSIDLALPTLRADSDSYGRLTNATHTADQWQMLADILTDPRSLKTDVLWAVYWSMFQYSQSLANALAQADVIEDVFTGKVTAELDRWLSDWGTRRIEPFGYPAARSYMGTFEIAGTREETRLGADIGMVVDIDIGGLVCRKVALFQAKKVVNGRANIGSKRKSSQLPKLSARPQTGFYLFYHHADHPVRSPAPTVCLAAELAECVTNGGCGLDEA